MSSIAMVGEVLKDKMHTLLQAHYATMQVHGMDANSG